MHSDRNRECVSNAAAIRFASETASGDGRPNHIDPSAVWKHPEPQGIAEPVNTDARIRLGFGASATVSTLTSEGLFQVFGPSNTTAFSFPLLFLSIEAPHHY